MKNIKGLSVLGFAMLLIAVMLHVSAAQSQHRETIAQVSSDSPAVAVGVSNGSTGVNTVNNGVVGLASLNTAANGSSGASSAIGKAKPYLASYKKNSKRYHKKYKKKKSKHKKKKYKHKKYKKKKSKHKKYKRHKLKRVTVSRGSMRACDVEAAVRRVGASYWPSKADQNALVWIYKHECVTPGVISSAGYYGLFQLGNPPSWMVLGDPASETKAGCEYIKRRYGNPSKAMAFKKRRGWY